MSVRTIVRAMAPVLAILLFAGSIFALTYYYDNKYIAPPPYGEEGVFSFNDDSLTRPLSLVDGWHVAVDGANETETFIGQYSNFSFIPGSPSSFGQAVYTLTLNYVGSDTQRALVLLLPEVFGNYELLVDNRVVAQSGDGPNVGLIVGQETQLKLVVSNDAYYYSGLTYPPVLGTAESIGSVQFVNTAASCVLVLVPLVAAVASFAVRRRGGGDKLMRDFAVLCAAFALAGAHGLVWQLGISDLWWYALEDASWVCVLITAVAVAARAAGVWEVLSPRRSTRVMSFLFWMLPALSFVWVALIIPPYPASIGLYGMFQTGARILCWALLVACAAVSVRRQSADAHFVLAACVVMGTALLANLLDNNAYEPLYGLWQQEYAGLMLVAVFGWMLIARVRRLRAARERVRDLEVQVRSAQESLTHLQQGELALRAAQHDMRHHLNALKRFAEEGEWERGSAYLDDLLLTQNAQPPLRYTQNLVVNAVMAAYLAPAQKKGVQVYHDIDIPESLALKDTEVVVLLSNLLSNATEAGERALSEGVSEVYVRLFLRVEGDQLVIRCENTAPIQVNFESTSKPDKQMHGFGLSTMTHLAESHGGMLAYEIQGGVATVRIVVPFDKELRSR